MKTMSKEWFETGISLEIDRLTLFVIVGGLELALRHPRIPQATSETIREVGIIFSRRLVADGLRLPEDVRRSWESTFKINLYPV